LFGLILEEEQWIEGLNRREKIIREEEEEKKSIIIYSKMNLLLK
jgi:hypothetical protein